MTSWIYKKLIGDETLYLPNNTNIYIHVQNNLPLNCILSRVNPSHQIDVYFLAFALILFPYLRLVLRSDLLSLVYLDRNLLSTFYLPRM
jgi:hypothetical protein